MAVKLYGEENLSLFERIKRRRRSTNPTCWTCKDYPNCGMCSLRWFLRRQPVSSELPEELREAVITICKIATAWGCEFYPDGGRFTSDVINKLEQRGIIECVRRGSNYTRSLFTLNYEYSDEVKALYKRYYERR